MEEKQKKFKPIKLATKSPHLDYFMPMLQNFSEQGELNEVVKNCVCKACDIMDAGIPLYPNNFKRDCLAAEIHAKFDDTPPEISEISPDLYSFSGRMMLYRSFGKMIFFDLVDNSGKIQCYADKSSLSEEDFVVIKKLDVGDIVGVTGTLFTTKTGELTVRLSALKLLSKAFRALPDKYKGFTDVESRYRQRYVDLIMNKRTRDIFVKRSLIVRELRNFMEEKGFMEVETPMMHAVAGGAAAKPFKTHHNALNIDLFMRIAPELHLKRLITGGFEQVFEINRCFRNEGIDTRHNPEFTSCEFYWAYATYQDLMDFTEELMERLSIKVCGSPVISYQGIQLDFTRGHWQRLAYHEALEKIGGFKSDFYNDKDAIKSYLDKHNERYLESDGLGKLQSYLFDLEVEEKLVQPTFIYAYPAEISPLSRRNEEHPELTDRFEFFICGCEYGNAFSELNDPIDQRNRFLSQVEAKAAGDEEACPMDNDYLRALEFAMPPTAGEGIGIDRLTMLFTDEPSIREVILFPLLRPEV